MNDSPHILVVDDDPEVRDVIDAYLSEEGFRVSLAGDGQGMRDVLNEWPVDAVILDVRLPGEDGLTLAAEFRRKSDAGIIMLSRKQDLVDRVAGLEVGADDYVPKPFHLRELLARLRSVLRRRQSNGDETAEAAADGEGSIARFGGFELDLRKRVLIDPDGEPVDISTGELDLLVTFVENPKRPMSRDELLDLSHCREAALFDRSIDVQVGRLRRKLEANPRRPELIKTVRNVGYVLDTEVLKD